MDMVREADVVTREPGVALITRDDLVTTVRLLRNEAFPLPQRLTYLCLGVLMEQEGCEAGQLMRAPVEWIADIVGVSAGEVDAYIQEAVDLGLLQAERRTAP